MKESAMRKKLRAIFNILDADGPTADNASSCEM